MRGTGLQHLKCKRTTACRQGTKHTSTAWRDSAEATVEFTLQRIRRLPPCCALPWAGANAHDA
eukprot:118837-Chlamydomonas_euryale.AAC.2